MCVNGKFTIWHMITDASGAATASLYNNNIIVHTSLARWLYYRNIHHQCLRRERRPIIIMSFRMSLSLFAGSHEKIIEFYDRQLRYKDGVGTGGNAVRLEHQ